jgi:hypothetical protein
MRKFELQTKYSTSKTEELLMLYTRDYKEKLIEKHLFEGRLENGKFKVYPLFNYGVQNQLRPEIHGIIKSKGSGSIICIECKWPSEYKYLGIFIFLFNAILIFILIIASAMFWNLFQKYWWILLTFYAFTILLFYMTMDSKIAQSKEVLKKLFQ